MQDQSELTVNKSDCPIDNYYSHYYRVMILILLRMSLPTCLTLRIQHGLVRAYPITTFSNYKSPSMKQNSLQPLP